MKPKQALPLSSSIENIDYVPLIKTLLITGNEKAFVRQYAKKANFSKKINEDLERGMQSKAFKKLSLELLVQGMLIEMAEIQENKQEGEKTVTNLNLEPILLKEKAILPYCNSQEIETIEIGNIAHFALKKVVERKEGLNDINAPFLHLLILLSLYEGMVNESEKQIVETLELFHQYDIEVKKLIAEVIMPIDISFFELYSDMLERALEQNPSLMRKQQKVSLWQIKQFSYFEDTFFNEITYEEQFILLHKFYTLAIGGLGEKFVLSVNLDKRFEKRRNKDGNLSIIKIGNIKEKEAEQRLSFQPISIFNVMKWIKKTGHCSFRRYFYEVFFSTYFDYAEIKLFLWQRKNKALQQTYAKKVVASFFSCWKKFLFEKEREVGKSRNIFNGDVQGLAEYFQYIGSLLTKEERKEWNEIFIRFLSTETNPKSLIVPNSFAIFAQMWKSALDENAFENIVKIVSCNVIEDKKFKNGLQINGVTDKLFKRAVNFNLFLSQEEKLKIEKIYFENRLSIYKNNGELGSFLNVLKEKRKRKLGTKRQEIIEAAVVCFAKFGKVKPYHLNEFWEELSFVDPVFTSVKKEEMINKGLRKGLDIASFSNFLTLDAIEIEVKEKINQRKLTIIKEIIEGAQQRTKRTFVI